MDTPQKNVTQIGTPVSKLKAENSPVFNFINSLSPIKPMKSIPMAQTLSSLNFGSPPSVFTSPHATSHKESRFRSQNKSSDLSKDVSVSDKDLTSIGEEEEVEILKNDCITPGVITDDSGMNLHNNIKAKSETPDWETLISDSDILIYDSPNDSEAFRCFLQRTSNPATMEPPSNTNESESSDALSMLHRGVRRRCLDFEISGSNKQKLSDSSSRCVVPSIGLHLNAIAMSSKDNNVGNIKVGLQGSSTLLLHSPETEKDEAQEAPKSSPLVELNQTSPKKKRRKSEQTGEGESSCKRCNCKKSKCLKLYCECFAAGVYCIEPCSCVDCFNKPIHEDTVLATRKQIESRNPLAFAPKVIRTVDSIMEAGEDASKTPASSRHKRGCNCKKSNCLKKYCECYQSGVGCSINCRCEGCKNGFGRKEVSSFVGADMEQDDETETSTKTQQKTELFNSVQLSTPMSVRQPLSQISSNNKLLPHHLHEASGSSSGLHNKNHLSLLSHSRFETITEEITEDIENLIQSPNSKRVSLDSSESTPLLRNGGRKLILSIPSFPSLTPHF